MDIGPTKSKPHFLVYLHHFRGFAILNIVAIHAIAFAIYTCNNSTNNTKTAIHITNEILFHNSTIYFAIISGILFSAILKQKGYRRFYANKIKYVILPYLFLTLIFSIYKSTHTAIFVLHDSFEVFIEKVMTNLIYGKAQFTFWYIPILLFLYLVTPAFDYIISLKRWGRLLTLIIVLSPLIISRVPLFELRKTDLISLSTMIYFSGAYMAGICFGYNPENWLHWIKKNSYYILTITIIVSLVLVYLETLSYKTIGGWSLKSTLYYIQKICLGALFILFFKTLEKKQQPKWLNIIAKNAFIVYFLHAFFIVLSYRLLSPIINPTQLKPLYIILVALLFLLISTTCSIFVAWSFKKCFGKYSKMLVGS